MKKYFILIFIFSYNIIFCGNRIEEIKNKKIINNIVYFKNESFPFTGKFVGKNIEEQYEEGIREGYYKNIIIIDEEKYICEGRFDNGLKNGQWIIKSFEGKLKAILKYYYDRPLGEWKYFNLDGSIMGIESFKDGELQGKVEIFNAKGIPKIKMSFEEGLLNDEFTSYYINGKISAIANFSYGKLNGELKLFSTQGLTTVEGRYLMNERDGQWKYYYNTGELKSIVNYKNGKRDGKSIIYGKGGEVLQELNYSEGVDQEGKEEYKNYKDKILEGFKKFTEELEYKKYDEILDEI